MNIPCENWRLSPAHRPDGKESQQHKYKTELRSDAIFLSVWEPYASKVSVQNLNKMVYDFQDLQLIVLLVYAHTKIQARVSVKLTAHKKIGS